MQALSPRETAKVSLCKQRACDGIVDLEQFRTVMLAEHGRHLPGTWHVLSESLTNWSRKSSRPWLVLADYGSGPTLPMVPRTTQDHGLSTGIPHAAHTHAETDSDSHTCKIRKRGRVCSDARRNHPRAWVRDEGTYSCREPDDDLLLALGCAW